MIKYIFLLLVLLCNVAVANPTHSNIVYPSPGGQNNICDIYLSGQSSLPTVIMVHGGGYCCGDKAEFSGVADIFKSYGFNIININYTLTNDTTICYPQAVHDIHNIVVWTKLVLSVQYSISNQIILIGSSAGGTLVTEAAYTADEEQSVILVATLSGRSNMVWDFEIGNYTGNVLNYFGFPMSSYNRFIYEEGSSLYHVRPWSPKTIVYHAISDPIVPFKHGYQLISKLRANNVDTIGRFPEGNGHALGVFGDTVTAANMLLSDISSLLSITLVNFIPYQRPVVINHDWSLADVAGLSGISGPDNMVTVDDLQYFLNNFFDANELVADLAGIGGVQYPDGLVTIDDLVYFLNKFFQN